MSSSCRKVVSYTLLTSLGAAPAAWAQQNFFVPQVETSAEWNSNRELTPVAAQEDASSAYKVLAEARMGQRAQRYDYEFRPRVVYQNFPDREGIDPVDFFADLRGERRSLRGTYGVFAHYERQDTYNAEFGTARFDDLDPNNPTNGDTGIVLRGSTRTRVRIEPAMEYALSERNLIGAHFRFDTQDYGSSQVGSLVGYDAEYIDVALIRQMGPRTELSVGPYFEHFENDIGGKSDATGLVFGIQHDWSEISSINVSIRGESTDSSDPTDTGVEVSDTTTNWAVEVSGRHRFRVGGLRFTLGRFLEPSSVGSRREQDSIRVQFDRPLSQRLGLYTALRYTEDREIGRDETGINVNNERDRAYGELYLRGDLTQEWYLTGGYRFAMLDAQSLFGKGENHAFFISFGFQGLRPPSR